MARQRRITRPNIAYHVMNRTWGNIKLFEDAGDYEAFECVLAEAAERFATMRICAYCLMPNHFHLILWPRKAQTLSRFMQWLGQTHAARWHAHRHSPGRGHLYQSRFKSFPIQQDQHFLNVCRYVERNALRVDLVPLAQDWRWSSLSVRLNGEGMPLKDWLSDWPVAMPADYVKWVNRPQNPKELSAIRCCRERGIPFGDEEWVRSTAITLGLESTLRPVGRPKKKREPEEKE